MVSGTYHFTYGYNQAGEMMTYKFITTTTYGYNGNGLEASTKVGSTTEQYIWDSAGSLARLLSDGADYFVYGPARTPVEQYNVTTSPPTSNPTFLTYLAPSDSWIVTSKGGAATNLAGYDAYGNLSNGAPGTIFGFAGQATDDAESNPSGLVDMRARFYTTQAGEFTSVDPMEQSTHQLYSYSLDDPINESDPSGDTPRTDQCASQRATCPTEWTRGQVSVHPQPSQRQTFKALGTSSLETLTLSVPNVDKVALSIQSNVYNDTTFGFSLTYDGSTSGTITIPMNGGFSTRTFSLSSPWKTNGISAFDVQIRATEGGAPYGGAGTTLEPPSTFADYGREYDPGKEGDAGYAPCPANIRTLGSSGTPQFPYTLPGMLNAAYLVDVRWFGPPALVGPSLAVSSGVQNA